MFLKILIIALAIGLAFYWARNKLGFTPAYIPTSRQQPLAFTLLCVGALVLFILSVFCAVLWLAGVSDSPAMAGNLASGTGLLRIAIVLLVLSLASAVSAIFKRPRT